MWTLIVTLLLTNGNTINVNIHTAAPTERQCMMDQPSMAEALTKYAFVKIVKWRCEDTSKRDI